MNTKPIIFINGMMKTGTTLLSNLFDGHKDINVFPDETVFEVLYENSKESLFDNFIKNNNCRLFRKIYGQKKHEKQSKSFEKIFTDELINNNIDCNKFKKNFSELKNINESYLFIKNFFNIFFSSLNEDQKKIFKKKYVCYKSPSFSNPKSKSFLLRQVDDILKVNNESKIIIPLRDPENLIKSLILHEIRVHGNKFNFFKRIFFIIKSSFEIESTLKDYSKLSKNTYFFKYEDLIENSQIELKKLLNFLEIDYDETLKYTSIFNKKISSETAPIESKNFKILKKDQLASKYANFTKLERYLINLFDVYKLNFLNNDHPLKKTYNYKYLKLSRSFFIKKIILIILKFYYK
tara:strand:+ start:994 stop:2043 length:1050 start_codon:yes stop_codon:yes gene_type:complete